MVKFWGNSGETLGIPWGTYGANFFNCAYVCESIKALECLKIGRFRVYGYIGDPVFTKSFNFCTIWEGSLK